MALGAGEEVVQPVQGVRPLDGPDRELIENDDAGARAARRRALRKSSSLSMYWEDSWKTIAS